MMFRPRRAARLGAGPGRAGPGQAVLDHEAVDQAVRDAEAVVSQAWGRELLRQCDQMEFAVHAAYEDCDTAHRTLIAAQHDGDLRRIVAAHAALEQALSAADTCAVASEKIRTSLCAELDLLARATKQRAIEHLVRDLETTRPALTVLWAGLAVREGWRPGPGPSAAARLRGRIAARWFVARWNFSCRVGASRLCRVSAGLG
jgi:hypothetical protein